MIYIYINNTKYHNIPTWIVGRIIGSSVFVLSPFIVVNWIFNGVYIDKIIDKYDYRIIRIHQYGANNHMYGFPSSIYIKINSVEEK